MSAKSGQIVTKMWAFISPCAFSTAVLHMQALKAWQSPKILVHKWGGGGGPPLGGVNGIGAKSAALLAAPGVSEPTAFYACINILLFLP